MTAAARTMPANVIPLPRAQRDPIFAAIAAHRAAHGKFMEALSIPETPAYQGPRDREEVRTMRALHRKEVALSKTQPTTILGVLALFDYMDEIARRDKCRDHGMAPFEDICPFLDSIRNALRSLA